MFYPGTAVRAERVALGVTIQLLAAMTDGTAPVLAAWETEHLIPCDRTIRTTIAVLVTLRRLHRSHGYIPTDDDTVRWVRERVVGMLGRAVA